jgi:hypothetical protein
VIGAEVLAAIQASAEAVKAVFGWLCTPEGQATSKSMREDRAAWDKFWSEAGSGLTSFFKADQPK